MEYLETLRLVLVVTLISALVVAAMRLFDAALALCFRSKTENTGEDFSTLTEKLDRLENQAPKAVKPEEAHYLVIHQTADRSLLGGRVVAVCETYNEAVQEWVEFREFSERPTHIAQVLATLTGEIDKPVENEQVKQALLELTLTEILNEAEGPRDSTSG